MRKRDVKNSDNRSGEVGNTVAGTDGGNAGTGRAGGRDVGSSGNLVEPVGASSSQVRVDGHGTAVGAGGIGATQGANGGSAVAGDGAIDGGRGNRRGRLRNSQRQSAGTGTGTGTGAGARKRAASADEMAVRVEEEEPPQRRPKQTRLSRKAKEAAQEELTKKAIVSMIGVTVNGIYHAASLKFGEHWKLNDKESVLLSVAIDDAISTLPGEVYAKVIEALAKYTPFAALGYTLWTVTAPRVEQSRQRAAKRVAGEGNLSPNKSGSDKSEDIFGNWSTIAEYTAS